METDDPGRETTGDEEPVDSQKVFHPRCHHPGCQLLVPGSQLNSSDGVRRFLGSSLPGDRAARSEDEPVEGRSTGEEFASASKTADSSRDKAALRNDSFE